MISQETHFLTDDSLSIHFNDRVWRGMGIGLTTKKKFTQKNTSRMYLFIVMAFKYEKAGLDISLNVLLCQHKKKFEAFDVVFDAVADDDGEKQTSPGFTTLNRFYSSSIFIPSFSFSNRKRL